MAVINEIPTRTIFVSVILGDERAGTLEFLKAHAIMSRSWLMAALGQKGAAGGHEVRGGCGELVRWYRGDHDIFDVCADDHCQRYQGITKIISGDAAGPRETRGSSCSTGTSSVTPGTGLPAAAVKRIRDRLGGCPYPLPCQRCRWARYSGVPSCPKRMRRAGYSHPRRVLQHE